jgi:hypothetical protein
MASSPILTEYLAYYATPSLISQLPGPAASLLQGLEGLSPTELVPKVAEIVVQSLIVHRGA